MSSFWLFLVAPVAVVGAIMFFMVYGEQRETQEAVHLEQQRDRAEFDANFQKSWEGKADPQLEARAQASNEQLAKQEERKQAAQEAARAQQSKELDELKKVLESKK